MVVGNPPHPAGVSAARQTAHAAGCEGAVAALRMHLWTAALHRGVLATRGTYMGAYGVKGGAGFPARRVANAGAVMHLPACSYLCVFALPLLGVYCLRRCSSGAGHPEQHSELCTAQQCLKCGGPVRVQAATQQQRTHLKHTCGWQQLCGMQGWVAVWLGLSLACHRLPGCCPGLVCCRAGAAELQVASQ